MTLPPGFAFSQSSLHAYADCPRRFQLRYLLGTRWPAAGDEPSIEREQRMRQGAAFHHLVHQHTLGIPVEKLTPLAAQGDLRRWWNAYLNAAPAHLPTTLRRAEVRLSTPIDKYRLLARYDLLAIDPGRQAVIVDWKTEQYRPRRAQLAKRWQTLVYPFVLARAGRPINANAPILPEQIEMIYWFANYPAQTERFAYDRAQHTQTEQTLLALIHKIKAHQEAIWPLTDDANKCRYCTYRTLCDLEPAPGKAPLPAEWEADTPEDDLDDLALDQAAEIDF